jgi:nucleotide-binding universal stress UspA family protein
MSRPMRILVPADFSPTSELALQYALDIAPAGAWIHVLHVIDEAGLLAAYPDGMYVELPAARDELIAAAEGQLAALVRKVVPPNIVVTTEAVVGRPVTQIAETAKTRAADLIVMGTHGRGALAHLMMGSVTERVVRTAQCPVLTVRDNSRAADVLAEEVVSHRLAAHP